MKCVTGFLCAQRRAISFRDFALRAEIERWIGVDFCTAGLQVDRNARLHGDQLGREHVILDVSEPTGPLTFQYHLPMAGMAYEVSKGFTFKTNWNYYDYKEYSDGGPTLPRNFRGNVVTLSIRYAF